MIHDLVFVDTVALIALSSGRDGLHRRSLELMNGFQELRQPLVTSEWVLTEYLASASSTRSRQVVIGITDAIRKSSQFTVVEATHASWEAAYVLYRERLDKAWSHVDCSSIQICERMGVRRVFTKDHHFVQAGFEILLP